MSDSVSGVIIPLVIPPDSPSSLAVGVRSLAQALESSEYSDACLQLQQSFCYLVWHFADFSARQLRHLGSESEDCPPFGHSRLSAHLELLQKNLDVLAQLAAEKSEAGEVFRVFYVGGLRARPNSPRRHTRLLGLGGQSIRGYRSILEWCRLEMGEEEFAGELRCQRELRRYLPILREWLDSASAHFRSLKQADWYQQSAPAPEESDLESPEPDAEAAVVETPAGAETVPAGPPALTSFATPVLLFAFQQRYEEQAGTSPEPACRALGSLAGLAIHYIFAISAAALRDISALDPALEKRIDSGLSLRQKQTSLSFLYKALVQHQAKHPVVERISRIVHAPDGGKLAPWLGTNWGSGHTLAEFSQDSQQSQPERWQERFVPGLRIWLQQMAPWFAEAEHYFQPPNEQGFVSFTVQIGDEHLEIDRKSLQLDTAGLKLDPAEVLTLLTTGLPSAENLEPAPEPVAEPPAVEEPVASEPEPVAELPAVEEPVPSEPEPVAEPPAVEEPAATEPEPVAELPAVEKPVPSEPEPVVEPPAAEEPAASEPEPVAEPPIVEEPVVSEPEPVAEPPAVEEPVPSEPEPVAEPSAVEEPSASEPVASEPEPVVEPPAAEEPAASEPEPVAEPLIIEEPVVSEPEPVAEPPIVEEPVASEPEPVAEPPAVEEPSATEPEPVAEPLIAEEPVASEPEPVAEPLIVEEPVVSEPVAQPPAVEEAVASEPEPVAEPPAVEEPSATEPVAEPLVAEAVAESESLFEEDLPELGTLEEATSAPTLALSESAATKAWSGPVPALELWDRLAEAPQADELLRLAGFLMQYTLGITWEWERSQDLPDEHPESRLHHAEVLDALRLSLQEHAELDWIGCLRAAGVAAWLEGPEAAHWLRRARDYRADVHTQLGMWLSSLQSFFGESEQLFEDLNEEGYLEGVVIYQDLYLELVDHPIYLGPLSGAYWAESESAPAPEAPPSPPPELDFSALPREVLDHYAADWSANPAPAGLAAGLEFLIQYFAGLSTSAAIQEAALEASHLEAWRFDSNLLQRLQMLEQVLEETRGAETPVLSTIQQLFSDSVLAPVWQAEKAGLANLAFALRAGRQLEQAHAQRVLHSWLSASRSVFAQFENLCEPIDGQGHLELVVQYNDDFFELVDPEYLIVLIGCDSADWREALPYRGLTLAEPALPETPPPAQPELLEGSAVDGLELSGGALPGEIEDDFFSGSQDNHQDAIDKLFAPPEPEPAAGASARPTLVAAQEEEAPAPAKRNEYTLNTVLDKLLEKPEESPPGAAEAETPAPAPKSVPARLDAPAPAAAPQFIVVDPPVLEHQVHYGEAQGSTHHGRIALHNAGGGLLKGTVKSNHPCLRVKPSVFRSNDAEIEYWIDDNDRPSNLSKIGLTLHYSGQKLEISIEKLLPDKKFAQLAKKVFGLVRNLGKSKKS